MDVKEVQINNILQMMIFVYFFFPHFPIYYLNLYSVVIQQQTITHKNIKTRRKRNTHKYGHS